MNAFKLARMRIGLTQLNVARAAAVSEGKITRIETGRHEPCPALRRKLASILTCDEAELCPPQDKCGGPRDVKGR